MKITDVTPVLLICLLVANVYCDQTNIRTQQAQQQQPLDPQLQQLTQSLQQLYESFRQPLLPSQQPPFGQTNPPQQQTHLQQPLQAQQQPYRPFLQSYPPQHQSYTPLHQPYPPLQQPTQYFRQPIFQPLLCPPSSTQICADGRPAICTQHAVLGIPVYNCPIPILQNGLPWISRPDEITPSPSANSIFSAPNPFNSTGSGFTGAHSLLEMLSPGSNTDNAPPPTSDTTNSMDQGLNVDAVVNQGQNPSKENLKTRNEPYCPYGNPLCSICSFLVASFAPFQPCKPGKSGNPQSSNYPLLSLSQPGYVQTDTSIQLPSVTLPVQAIGKPVADLSSANVAQPGYLAAHRYPSPVFSPPGPRYSPGFQLPSYSGQAGSYQPPGPMSVRQQTIKSPAVSNDPKSHDTVPLSAFPELTNYIYPGRPPLSYHQQHVNKKSNPNNVMNQPIGTAPQAHPNQSSFSGGLIYPAYQRTVPLQPPRSPSIPTGLEFRQPERPTQLRLLESPRNQPPMSMGYTAISGLPRQNVPTLQGPKSLATFYNPLQNPSASAQGNLGYQVPGMPGSMAQRVQPLFQSGYQSINQFSSPLVPEKSQHHHVLKRTPDTKNTNQPKSNPHYVPTAQNSSQNYTSERKQNSQSLPSYLSSGLSLLSPQGNEEPSGGGKSLGSDDKVSLKTKLAKKTKRRRKTNKHI